MPVKAKNWKCSFSLLVKKMVTVLFLWCMAWMYLPAATPRTGDEPDNAVYFSMIGYHFQGNVLVFDYKVKFPGVTILMLTDSKGQTVWANQYVDDVEGPHQIALKTTKLKPGDNYTFRFKFKEDVVVREVTIP